MEKIKVLVVDDSSLMRNLLARIIAAQPDMEVAGTAPDAIVAGDMIALLAPHVLTLDIEMPRMDGLQFLEQLMRRAPMPVVMVSTQTEAGAQATMRALELGAFDFVPKPKLDRQVGLAEYAAAITDKIRAAARGRLRPAPPPVSVPASPPVSAPALPPAISAMARLAGGDATAGRVIVVGASTGGTEAIRELLSGMPADAPGILITQHMPAGFTKSFAERLNKYCKLAVKQAEDGERVLPGHAYVAPGTHHLLLRRSGAGYSTALSDGPPVNRHRPSVEVLFRSAAEVAGERALGVMLTGMGRDGAAAMRDMRDAGAWNIVQDEATCVVFGMPREAIAAGAAHEVAALDEIAGRLVQRLAKSGPRLARV